MKKLSLALTSRTTWTIVALFLFNGISAVSGLVPEAWLPTVNGLLSVLAIYFKVNPSQKYLVEPKSDYDQYD